LLLGRFQFLDADLGAFLFVSIAAGRSAENDQREQAKESEKQDHADPRRESRLRLIALEWFWRGHS
jgi:hypothetical protein